MNGFHRQSVQKMLLTNYFASSDPHHGIQFIPSDILSGISVWHSIWHVFWHSIWNIFWHSIWHVFWHSIWQIFWHSIWHIFWHSIWHSRWDPARLTAIKSWQMRSGEEGRRKEEGGRTTRRRSRASDIKSNNPHLAGGEQTINQMVYFHSCFNPTACSRQHLPCW